jgi:hypothetical protein
LIGAGHAAGEVGGDGHGELHAALADHLVQLGGRAGLGGEVEIVGVLQRADDRAREDRVLLHQHRGRQVARLGVDRIAEQQELDDRQQQHQRIGDAVAGELLELLDHHRGDAACGRAGAIHAKLSSAWPISWMKTSSSVGSTSSQR